MAKKERDSLVLEKRAAIAGFIRMYGIKDTGGLQAALKDLLGGTIKEMLEAQA